MGPEAIRRLETLAKILSRKTPNGVIINSSCTVNCRHNSSFPKSDFRITIGDVTKLAKAPKHPEYVPVHYLKKDLSQTVLSDLRWMLQKENMGQDMFLIGRPGLRRRQLVMSYLELTKQEVEFVSLSRDTTESDLKQRREIVSGSAEYIHQSAVRAAIEGRILVLEGIEKAERNVLPVLNNLLENREMHLEDGRFLISPANYDKLLKEYGKEHLKTWKLLRVSDDFRVIALGLPVPGYAGNPLDPPLRSRFQARDIELPPYEEYKKEIVSEFPEAPLDKVEKLLSCGYVLLSPESKSLNLPDFPLDNVKYAGKILEQDPGADIYKILSSVYPYKSVMGKEGKRAVEDVLKKFQIHEREEHLKPLGIDKEILNNTEMVLYINNNPPLQVKTGNFEKDIGGANEIFRFIEMSYHESLLSDIIHTHTAVDFCIIGPPGCGKSAIVKQFAGILNYEIEPIVLYKDMTSRDLIQQRTTTANGDTVWKNSPLVEAALKGKLAVLDGLHRVHSSTLAVLHRLIHDRELQLHDGKRLLRHDRYDQIAAECTEERLQLSGVLRIHPSFRIIGLAETPDDRVGQWLSPELLSLFLYHQMRRLTSDEELNLVRSLYRKIHPAIVKIIEISEKLRSSPDPTLVALSASLSTRQILRIAKRTSVYPEIDTYNVLNKACLAKFLPPLTKQAFESLLYKADLRPWKRSSKSKKSITVNDTSVQIGSTTAPRYKTDASSKIPDTLFYDLPQHVDLLEEMLQDFSIGEHLLLVGNQGVGKNKVTDKLLQLLNRPREYIQLHRDTTVQSLTLQPTIVDGVVQYEDSPLVKAVMLGHVLVVDEADKAPTHVTCILKTLVESAEMILSDGRRIVPSHYDVSGSEQGLIKLHPDFRIIVLANRPGFPFLGNNLFSALGDLFSCHIVDNPSPESEKQLLRSYGPDVSEDVIERIVSAFGELRDLADRGLVSYPYSTREAVNIIKHLQAFPNDSLSDAVSNVFDFDQYSREVQETLQSVLSNHQIPVQPIGTKVLEKRDLQMTIGRDSGLDVSGPKHGKVDETGAPHVGGNTWAGGTGGRDTAGLGGKGGPYRLDAGHKVYQLSDEEKDDVPEHIRKAAREMGREAFKKRLKEIQMSEYDAKLYNEFSSSVQKQVQALRVLLNNLQAKSKERHWVRHQTSGELDDTKLVEGITGEKGIYRRRTDVEPEAGALQLKPKRLRLVVDVSGSMYRFNGYDGRLDREMEAVIMVMEAFEGYESRIIYDIVGHSGEALNIVFVSKNHPPINNKQRLEVIKTMHAHAQFCWTGDNTLDAIRDSIGEIEKEKEDFDEGIVIILSDANLARYGIAPKELTQALLSSDTIGAYAIFIGSLGNEALKLTNSLPAGRGFVCMDLQNIPQIIQQIFTSSLLSSST